MIFKQVFAQSGITGCAYRINFEASPRHGEFALSFTDQVGAFEVAFNLTETEMLRFIAGLTEAVNQPTSNAHTTGKAN